MGCCYTALAHAHVATGQAAPELFVSVAEMLARVVVLHTHITTHTHTSLHTLHSTPPVDRPFPTQSQSTNIRLLISMMPWVGRFYFFLLYYYYYFCCCCLLIFSLFFSFFFIKWWSCAYLNMAALNFAACVYYDCSRWHCLAPGQHQLQLLE